VRVDQQYFFHREDTVNSRWECPLLAEREW
jgi:hypothetical protein